MEVGNVDFLVSTPTMEDLDLLSKPLENWNITKQTVSEENPIKTTVSNDSTQPAHFQHVRLKITKMESGGIHISNRKVITKLLEKERLAKSNSVSVPYKIPSDLSATKENDVLCNKSDIQSAGGTLRVIADTTHPVITWIVGMLGRHLHNPAQLHLDALKPIYRYLSSRKDRGPTYEEKEQLRVEGYTDSNYAADTDTRRSVTGVIILASKQPSFQSYVHRRDRLQLHTPVLKLNTSRQTQEKKMLT